MEITDLLAYSIEHKASDLHVSSGLAPWIRVDGDLRPINQPLLTHQAVLSMIHQFMNHQQKKEYAHSLELDFSFELADCGRFRVNAFNQSRGAAAVFRIIPSVILSVDNLNLPPILKQIGNFSKGLVLVTGPSGSGKSTTLAALIDYINTSKSGHILTLEDPIEFIHISKQCLVNQREVHKDTLTFNSALRSALREDPDVILVGELRDLETLRLAITAAETGHLVLASLHTHSAPNSINRIIDVFPSAEQSLVRTMLSESLQAVIAQNLIKKTGGGRVAALEIMLCTGAIRHLIRENKIPQMYSAIQTGQAKGMQTLDQHLEQLLQAQIISREDAYESASDKALFS